MKIPARTAAFVALSVAFAALFVRLGVWQLSRLEERQVENARRRAEIRYDTIVGVPDYAHEGIIKRRSNNGSPGVHIVTPVWVPARGDTVFVNRGWIYSPDAATVDSLPRWREMRESFSGYWAAMPNSLSGAPHKLYLVSRDSASPATPVRAPEPDFSNGPHLSYAIQWFCFAAIALVGGIIVARKAQGLPNSEPKNPVA